MCSGNNHDCHKMANCRPLAPGNYSCTCIDGYEGDGKNCRGLIIAPFPPLMFVCFLMSLITAAIKTT